MIMERYKPKQVISPMKKDLLLLKTILKEAAGLCDALEQPDSELIKARQQILQLESENLALRKQVGLMNIGGKLHKGEMRESLQDEVDQLLLKERHKNNELQDWNRELQNEIQFLKEQIEVITADFEMERKDRERAQSKIDDLSRRLTGNKDFVQQAECHHQHHHDRTVSRHQGRFRGYDVCDSPCQAVDDKPETNVCAVTSDYSSEDRSRGFEATKLCRLDSEQQQKVEVSNRGVVSLSKYSISASPVAALSRTAQSCGSLQTETDHLTKPQSVSTSGFNLPSYNSSTTLSCPVCRKIFLAEDHMHLIDHLEECH